MGSHLLTNAARESRPGKRLEGDGSQSPETQIEHISFLQKKTWCCLGPLLLFQITHHFTKCLCRPLPASVALLLEFAMEEQERMYSSRLSLSSLGKFRIRAIEEIETSSHPPKCPCWQTKQIREATRSCDFLHSTLDCGLLPKS